MKCISGLECFRKCIAQREAEKETELEVSMPVVLAIAAKRLHAQNYLFKDFALTQLRGFAQAVAGTRDFAAALNTASCMMY